MPIKLHSYWRSSASYRVRMALNLKGLDYTIEPVHLVRDGGQQHSEAYRALNPQGLVPTLEIDGQVISQSMAMLEYLEEQHPTPALLPADAPGRARVRAIANAIACDIHPLNNLRVLKYLVGELGVDEDAKLAWYRHWTELGLGQVEAMLDDPATGRFCHGDEPGLADCCLLPQVYNAQRFKCKLDAMPRILAICEALEQIPAIRRAAPENQPDAE
ncbi:maleylacetoacetate isomerase [Wenzhouxiangella marina]|uniref:Maleylpyruvate isomerase n=1 Tax=Wenzhouxiangella marina TaxID=1579979 RepID=A0A0K0XYK7_9GAMM|nr:maleylacetoacetate isomerase [Wenzhouxiangella marina]AKS42707.1 Maleylpyruvate isomerase [Wenzhouxiangella marina]MBB6088604.1 maleylacetoacetate isomerase/maleylpyruvate isomerase [Wenzhouxiangella marina]